MVLSGHWGDRGKALHALMNASQSWLVTQTGKAPFPSTRPRFPEGLWTLPYTYSGMGRVLQSSFEKHIVSRVLVLWKDGLSTLFLLTARPVSRSWKATREV